MAGMFDLKLLGDQALERDLAKLPDKLQKEAVSPEFRKSAERIKNQVLLNMSGRAVEERTGKLVAAFEAEKIKTRFIRSISALFVVWGLPSRAALGITPEDKFYFPTVLEYGSPQMPAKAPIRKAVNANQERELVLIGQGIRKRLDRIWARLGRGTLK